MKKYLSAIYEWWTTWQIKREDAYYARVARTMYTLDEVKKRLKKKRYRKPAGDLKILAVYKHFNWEDYNLAPALQKFGEFKRYSLENVNPYSLAWQVFHKRVFNRKFTRYVSQLFARGEINIIFFYASGLIFTPNTFRDLEILGIPMINLALDDYLKFKGLPTPTGWSGNIDICKYITITITSYREACERYLYEGGIPIYLPEGGNPEVFKPTKGVSRDIDVCFVGKNYGMREEIVDFLKQNGVKIEVYGAGWPNGKVSMDKLIELYSRAKIALSFSDSRGTGHFDLPGRDFEVPLIGPMYLTEYNPKIGEFYEVGKEIVLYKDREDLLEKIRYYLEHEDEREAIADAGRERARREHTWEKRFEYVFNLLGVH